MYNYLLPFKAYQKKYLALVGLGFIMIPSIKTSMYKEFSLCK